MQDVFKNITAITDAFSKKHLNANYGSLLRKLTAALCRKHPSPLLQGNINTWTPGMIHALGMVNFLFDKSQTPHVSSTCFSEYFNLACISHRLGCQMGKVFCEIGKKTSHQYV